MSMQYPHSDIYITDIIGYDQIKFNEIYTP